MRGFSVFTAIAIQLSLAGATLAQDELPASGQSVAAPRPVGKAPAVAPAGPEYMQQVSYGIGQNMAAQLQESQIEGIDLKALLAGISDALSGAKPKWTDEQLRPSMMRFTQEMRQKAETRMTQQAAKNKQEADTFLVQNAKREGVQTTASGLQYIILKEGNGPSPMLKDTIRCHYRGKLLNGTEFDATEAGNPAEFQVGPPLIEGWIEALQKMHVGEKWQLFVPPQLAYDANPPGPPIEPNSLLVFEIELVEIVR